MEFVRWTDNTCTAGWTCLTARLNGDGMRWLLSMVPNPDECFFRPCFHWPEKGYQSTTPELVDDYLKARDCTLASFYFNFLDGDVAAPLIAALKFKGFPMNRGESSFAEYD